MECSLILTQHYRWKNTAQKAQTDRIQIKGEWQRSGKNDLLCFISWTARQGQLEHIRENMRTTIMNIPELSTGGVTTSNCWILVKRSCDATSCRRFCGRTSIHMNWPGTTEEGIRNYDSWYIILCPAIKKWFERQTSSCWKLSTSLAKQRQVLSTDFLSWKRVTE